jgi:hypothetical protein
MTTTELSKYQQAIEEARETIPHWLDEFDEEHEPYGDHDNASEYADSMTNLVFDAIENSIFWTDKVNDLETFRVKIQEAVKSLDIAIEVWKRSEENGTEPNRKITKQHH